MHIVRGRVVLMLLINVWNKAQILLSGPATQLPTLLAV